jgi:type IV secretory pathway component VirB8
MRLAKKKERKRKKERKKKEIRKKEIISLLRIRKLERANHIMSIIIYMCIFWEEILWIFYLIYLVKIKPMNF